MAGWRKGIRSGFAPNGEVSCEGCFQKKLEMDRLRSENQKLKTELKRVQLGKEIIPIGAHTPSSQRPFKGKSSPTGPMKRGGAEVGHPGKGRRRISPEVADEIVEVKGPQICEGCRCKLVSHSKRERSILDVSEMKARKTLFAVERRKCPKCNKVSESKLPLFPGALYSNALLSQVAVMHYIQGIPIGRICAMLGESVSISGILSALHRIAAKWEPACEALIKEYRKSPVKHADETGWRIDGQPGWSWLFCSPSISIFECHRTRSSRVPKQVFGSKKLPGVLVVDRFNAYNQLPCQLQYCYAHLLREVKKLDDEFPDTEEVATFVNDMAFLLSDAMRLAGRSLNDSVYYREAQKIAGEIKALVHKPLAHPGIQSIQRIFTKNESRLFQWVLNRDVPAHNNRAERDLRQTVIARKVSFGSQSEKGARTRSTLMTVLATAQKRLNNASLESWFKSALDQLAMNPEKNPSRLLPALPP